MRHSGVLLPGNVAQASSTDVCVARHLPIKQARSLWPVIGSKPAQSAASSPRSTVNQSSFATVAGALPAPICARQQMHECCREMSIYRLKHRGTSAPRVVNAVQPTPRCRPIAGRRGVVQIF